MPPIIRDKKEGAEDIEGEEEKEEGGFNRAVEYLYFY